MVLGMLTDQQIETYRRDGYLVIPRLIQGDQLAELRGLTDRIVAEARGVSANDDLYDLEPSHSAALPRVRRLKPTIFKRYAFFHALAREPRITSMLASRYARVSTVDPRSSAAREAIEVEILPRKGVKGPRVQRN